MGVEIATKIDALENPSTDYVTFNMPRQLSRLQEKLTVFIRGKDENIVKPMLPC